MRVIIVRSFLISLCLGFMLSGCAQNGQDSGMNQTAGGAILGALGGAALGGALGGGKGALIGAALGAAAGAVIGNQLDARDRARREAALQSSLASAQPNQKADWSNRDTGNSGTITPLNTYTVPATDETCRDFDETYTRDGNTTSQRARACLGPDGNWVVQR
ncbi:MAG: RT0821/Lpp0805 family surface protein [Alphaproteobacteria bacterium]